LPPHTPHRTATLGSAMTEFREVQRPGHGRHVYEVGELAAGHNDVGHVADVDEAAALYQQVSGLAVGRVDCGRCGGLQPGVQRGVHGRVFALQVVGASAAAHVDAGPGVRVGGVGVGGLDQDRGCLVEVVGQVEDLRDRDG